MGIVVHLMNINDSFNIFEEFSIPWGNIDMLTGDIVMLLNVTDIYVNH